MQKTLFILVFGIISTRLLQAQGTFQNLDFESAQLIFEGPPYLPGEAIATTNALPGWSAFSGTNSLAVIPYGLGGFGPPVALCSKTNIGSLDGNYSVFLVSGSISQTAQVPADAQSLLFKATLGAVDISLGGQDLFYIAISNTLNYTLYGATIPSSFAGQTEALTFTGGGLLDDIQFSPEAIPEPSAISFLCLGSGVLFYLGQRKRYANTTHGTRGRI